MGLTAKRARYLRKKRRQRAKRPVIRLAAGECEPDWRNALMIGNRRHRAYAEKNGRPAFEKLLERETQL